jgi:hypothetical protein
MNVLNAINNVKNAQINLIAQNVIILKIVISVILVIVIITIPIKAKIEYSPIAFKVKNLFKLGLILKFIYLISLIYKFI